MEIQESSFTKLNELLDGIDRSAAQGLMDGKERQSLIDVKGMVTQMRKELYAGVSITNGGDAA